MTQYKYNSTDLTRPVELSEREEFLLKDSKTFCIYPWIHLHAYPTGEAYPCCHAEMGVGQVGNCRTHTLEEIWHNGAMTKLRSDMLSENKNATWVVVMNKKNLGSSVAVVVQTSITGII
jgi:MoaA/NifB/PqqE/SkfB family radical SAM enzyme